MDLVDVLKVKWDCSSSGGWWLCRLQPFRKIYITQGSVDCDPCNLASKFAIRDG